MVRELQFRVVPEIAGQEEALKAHISETLKINIQEIRHIEILSRSIDARQRIVYFNLKVLVFYSGGLCREADHSSGFPECISFERGDRNWCRPCGAFCFSSVDLVRFQTGSFGKR